VDFPVARLDGEHRAILSACIARDAEGAAAATREHLQNTVEHVATRLEQPE
jgi:DNA-binding GntR family transcriptional regulator